MQIDGKYKNKVFEEKLVSHELESETDKKRIVIYNMQKVCLDSILVYLLS